MPQMCKHFSARLNVFSLACDLQFMVGPDRFPVDISEVVTLGSGWVRKAPVAKGDELTNCDERHFFTMSQLSPRGGIRHNPQGSSCTKVYKTASSHCAIHWNVLCLIMHKCAEKQMCSMPVACASQLSFKIIKQALLCLSNDLNVHKNESSHALLENTTVVPWC